MIKLVKKERGGGGEEAEKSQYLNGIMLQCQHFRFNVASIICEVSEMKTVFRIKTFRLLAWKLLGSSYKDAHTLLSILANCFDIAAVPSSYHTHTFFAYIRNLYGERHTFTMK